MTATPTPNHAEWGFPNDATPLGSPTYYAVRFAPEPFRELYALLLAWFDAIQSIAHAPTDPGVARLKLDWWRTEVGQALDGDAPRHPLMTGLCAEGLGVAAIDAMQAIIDASEQHIRQPELSTIAAFTESCRQVGGNLFILMCQAGDASAYNRERCVALGGYWNGIERLRRFVNDPAVVPHQAREILVTQTDAGQRRECLEQLIEYPGSAKALRREVIPDVARRLVAGSQALHRRVARDGYLVTQRNVQRAPIANLWTAWRCSPSL